MKSPSQNNTAIVNADGIHYRDAQIASFHINPSATILYRPIYLFRLSNSVGAGATADSAEVGSQNLDHEQVLTTLTSYGTVARHRQAELIRAKDMSGVADTDERLTEILAETIRKYQSGRY